MKQEPIDEDTVMIGIVIRFKRKKVKETNLSVPAIRKLLVEAFPYDVSKALNAFSHLKLGNKFHYKHSGFTVTLEPLHGHIDNYCG